MKENIAKMEAYVIVNRVIESANVSKEIRDALNEYDIKTLDSKIANRVAYADSATQGLGVVEYKDKKAKEEMLRLAAELETIIEKF